MKVVTIEARDLSEVWWLCLKECLFTGYVYTIDRGSFEGQRRKEFDLITLRVAQPNIRPLVPEVPKGVPPPTTIEYVENEYLPYLMTSFKRPDEDYTYGEDLEPQIPKIISMFNDQGPGTNQACMTLGSRDSIDLKDPPCLRVIQCRVRYDKLHFIVYFRSWDLWGGFPGNLAGLQLMKEYMAQEIGVDDGELLCVSGGLHLYEHTWDYAGAVLRLEPELLNMIKAGTQVSCFRIP